MKNTPAIFENAVTLVIHHMQVEWPYFKKGQQGIQLLENLNAGNNVTLPDPCLREPVQLPDNWESDVDPGWWGVQQTYMATAKVGSK